MNRTDLDRKDWLLLVLSAANGQVFTPAQLQKTVFLLAEEQSEAVGAEFYEFEPYHFGPFCLDVYRDAEALEGQGFVSIHLNRIGRWQEYRVTQEGMNSACKLRQSVENEVISYIEEKVNWARSISFQDLIKAIYAEYPKFRANSVFQG